MSRAMLREIRESLSYQYHFTVRQAHHDYADVFLKTLRDLARVGCGDLHGKRILDLGCGPRFAFALQCAAQGAQVTALDLDYVQPDHLPIAFVRIWRHNGLKRAVKSILRRLIFDRRYYMALERAAQQSLRPYTPMIKFVIVDPKASRYPLPDESFDVIVSNAVVEHVQDMDTFAAEVSRLLTHGGYFYALIHNFYSLSGGHTLEWAYPDERPSTRVPPWDHLRENRFPTWFPLNRLRPEEYRNALARYLNILVFEGRNMYHDPGLEGERFLTPEIAAELAQYPRELLLTRAWCAIARKGNGEE